MQIIVLLTLRSFYKTLHSLMIA